MATIAQDSGVQDTLQALPKQGWYYGNISVEQCKLILKNEITGTFLIRDSPDSDNHGNKFSLMYKVQNYCYFTVIDYADGYFSFQNSPRNFPMFRTLMDLVSFCCTSCSTCKRPMCTLRAYFPYNIEQVSLIKTVSRHDKMHSLMFLCREVISQFVTSDNFSQLGLPVRLVENYLKKNPHFDEQLYINEESAEEDAVIQHGSGSSPSNQ